MAARPQPNFKLDVNRTKTKRWADAKAASYEGDDWGGYDEYGDFAEDDAEDDAEPPLPPAPAKAPSPPPKVTGLRQRGTNSNSVRDPQSSSSYNASPKATSPQATQQGSSRRLSFETGDEKRDFSNASLEPSVAPTVQAIPLDPVELPANELPGESMSSRPTSSEPPIRAEQRRSPQPVIDQHSRGPAERQPLPSSQGLPRAGDIRMPPSQGPMAPGTRLPDRPGPGNARFYAQNRTASGPAPGVPPPDGYQRREFSAPGSNQAPPQMRSRPSQEFVQGPSKKTSQEFRGPPPPRGQPDYRGAPPPRDYRGPPPGRDPRDYRGPQPPDSRGPPYQDPRGRGGPPFDPRGPPPRDYRGPPPQDYRGPPPQDYRGPPPHEFRGPYPGRGGPPSDFRQRPPPGNRGPVPEFRPRKESLSSQDRPASSASAGRVGQPVPNAGIPEVSVSAPGQHMKANEDSTSATTSPPIVRPADIYKRLPEERERERQSLESGRPSLDSAGQPRASTDSYREGDPPSKLKPRLDTVTERKSEYGMENKMAPLNPPLIPQFDRFSGFGLDLGWDTGPSLADSMSMPPAGSAANAEEPSSATSEKSIGLQQEQTTGLRDAVNDAFDQENKDDGLASVKSPPHSDMSRSNTDSTAGISPIMSRVPSASTAQRRVAELIDSKETPPPIPEEYRNGSRPTSASTMKASLHGPKGHEREPSADSSSSIRHFSTPEAVDGPAHTAAISERKRVDVSDMSKEGELALTTPVDTDFSADMSRRESDLAATANARATTSPEVGNEERQAQSSFVQSRQQMPPLQTRQPPASSSRPLSPSKGRVQELANKYDDQDRASDASSISSWSSSARPSPAQSRENLRIRKGSNDNERPSLPGQWISESTIAKPDDDASLKPAGLNSRAATPRGGRDQSPGDLLPTTTRQQLPGQTFESHAEGAMAQLAASGNALAQNLQAAIMQKKSPSPTPGDIQSRERSETTSTARPLIPPAGMQGAGSAASSVASTPQPGKDILQDRDGAPQRQSGYFANASGPPPLRVSNPDSAATSRPEQLSAGSGKSMDSSPGDTENDRLREDIFKSLAAPGETSSPSAATRPTLAPMQTDVSRDSSTSLIPREYDSYWNGSPGSASRDDSKRPSIVSKPSDTLLSNVMNADQATDVKAKAALLVDKPKLSNRFSWEEGEEAPLAPGASTAAAAAAATGPSEASMPRTSEERVPAPPSDDSDANSDAAFESDDEDTRSSPVDTRSPIELDGGEGLQASLPQLSPHPERPSSFPAEPSSPVAPRSSSVGQAPTSVPVSPAIGQQSFAKALPPLSGGPMINIPSFKAAGETGKTSVARTTAYRAAQHETATMSTGLEAWLVHMANAHPEHLSAGFGGARPSTANTGTVRAKMPHDLGQTGQAFMHGAGKLGGKASQGAKGLFAKGKSRFGRRSSVDKAPE